MAKLILKFKEAVLKEIPLEKVVTTIGRAQTNDIMIDNMAVSGFHAKVINDEGRFFIEDLNSTNGTFIREKKISKQPLTNNAIIQIGKHTLIFMDPTATDADSTLTILKSADSDATVMIDANKLREAPGEKQETISTSGDKETMLGSFLVIEGSTSKTEYDLTRRVTTIGKVETAEIRLKGFFAPKIAALVNHAKEGYYISPVGGEKRPVLNGKQIETATLLTNLDIVEVANLKLQFFLKDE
jgi:pSer/pThr/pTyr-binding forkhead associated (FHA) protein